MVWPLFLNMRRYYHQFLICSLSINGVIVVGMMKKYWASYGACPSQWTNLDLTSIRQTRGVDKR